MFTFRQIHGFRKTIFILAVFLNLFFIASYGFRDQNDENLQDKKIWGFGQSVDRKNDIWHKGQDGTALNKHQNTANNNKAVDTTGSIERALKEAERRERVKGKFGLSLEENSSAWAVNPKQNEGKIDEEILRDRKHILRAFAGVEKGDDFTISFGPELILKDEEHSAESAISDQPDSALGLGMKFKYDF